MTGSPAANGLVRHAEEVMGTVVSFAVRPGAAPAASVGAALAAACQGLHAADDVFSTWKPGSPVSRLRRGDLAVARAPSEVTDVLLRCVELRRLSRGWFDPWALPGGVDPTGMVKGWAAERAASVVMAGIGGAGGPDAGTVAAEAEPSGVAGVMVNAAGDIAVRGRPAPGEVWRLGIRHPWRPDRLAGVVALDPAAGEGALATSGLYERGLHLVDPFTGARPSRVASASVTGPDLATADALATAAAVAGASAFAEVIAAVEGYEAYVISWDGREWSSPGFPWADAGSGYRTLAS